VRIIAQVAGRGAHGKGRAVVADSVDDRIVECLPALGARERFRPRIAPRVVYKKAWRRRRPGQAKSPPVIRRGVLGKDYAPGGQEDLADVAVAG
jgi:hypothetical protein